MASSLVDLSSLQIGDELLDNITKLLNDIETASFDDMDNIILQQDHVYQIINIINQIRSVLNLTTDDIKYLDELIQHLVEIYQAIAKLCQSLFVSDCTNCTSFAFEKQYSLFAGRPKFCIPKDLLEELRGLGFTWTNISKMFNISRWTIARRVSEYDLQSLTTFSSISNDDLDQLISEYISRHGTTCGEPIISGYLRSSGYRVQRRRVRSSLNRVDPKNTLLRWGALVSRRTYYVPWANSLWHLDGHHSLIRWKFVIHGCIDGKSRKVMFLKCNTNNKAETVLDLFTDAVTENGWPSRVRVDYGVENTLVCDAMVETRGEGRASFIAGSSTRNQRIERLWRDVFRCVTVLFYYVFYGLEQSGMLDVEDSNHLFALHYVFLPRINFALNEFKNAYNEHRLSTERNWTPNQIWHNSMNNPANPLAVTTNDGIDDDFYREDPLGPYPLDPEVNNVVVEPVEIPMEEEISNYLSNFIEPNRTSSDMGIDIYVETMAHLNDLTGYNA